MKIVIIAAYDYCCRRACKNEYDYIMHCQQHADIMILWNTEFSLDKVKNFSPDIIYFFDCDYLRSDIIYYQCKTLNKPIALITDDLFYYSLIIKNPITPQLNAIVSRVKMQRIEQQYRNSLKHTQILSLKNNWINTNKFKDYELSKQTDILIYGTTNFEHSYHEHNLPINIVDQDYIKTTYGEYPPTKIQFYPFRKRLTHLILKNSSKYRIRHITCNNGSWGCDIFGEELSKYINQSYLTLATSSRIDKCMKKYVEIPASGSVILGNIPVDYHNVYDGNVVEVTNKMTDEEILAIIDNALVDKKNLEDKGKIFGKYIHEHYNLGKGVENLLEVSRTIYQSIR